MQTIFEGRNSDMKEKIIDDLLQYCKLDTLAMVEISCACMLTKNVGRNTIM